MYPCLGSGDVGGEKTSEIRQGALIEAGYTADCQIGQGGAAGVYPCRHVSLGNESFPAGETCAQTIPVVDGDDDVADPVWLAIRANPWVGARIWLAAGAIATAHGVNAGLVGAALVYGLDGDARSHRSRPRLGSPTGWRPR